MFDISYTDVEEMISSQIQVRVKSFPLNGSSEASHILEREKTLSELVDSILI